MIDTLPILPHWGMALLLITFAAVMAAACGGLLSWFARSADNTADQGEQTLIDAVNELLPQTQCAQCGYPGCKPYATAIIRDAIPVNQCPPGGQPTIDALSELLGVPTIALDAERGTTKPPSIAVIDEAACIGCTLCIDACPVDAIVGASRYMHTVIAAECTGCELCLPPCPVDCIDLVAPPETLANWQWPRPAMLPARAAHP